MTTPDATDPGDQADDTEGRLTGLEQAVTEIRDSLRTLVSGSTPPRRAGRAVVENHLDREADVATQVQAELARARAADDASATAKGHGDRLAGLEETVKNLAEKTPEPPQRGVERIMFGSRS